MVEKKEWEEMRENAVKHSVRTLTLAAMLLAVCMIAGGLSGSQSSMAYASVGSVNGTYYDNFDDLVDDVGSRSGETFTIAMTQDWKAGSNSDFDQRLIIPKNSRVTFNMHGYVFDRSRVHYDGWTSNGELICVESGATLTINGGSEKRKHTHNIFTSLKRSDYASTPATFEGGLLTGGDSTNGGGGMHIKADANVTLNNVTIAGCRAEQRGSDGFGGGISIAGSGTTLKLNDSTITGCYAYNDGGGIHVDNDNNVRIELVGSHVDKNYSGSDGGGIDVEGESIVIKGDENSTISNNMTQMYGGGVYLWNDEETLTGTGKGLTIEGNHAREGGGIYTQEETISLSSLNILNNEVDFWSVGYGGGVYVNNDNTVILNCRITGNRANVGGGVYTNVDEDPVNEGFFVNGATVIKDNVGRSAGSNLTLVNGNNRVRFGLTSGADVHMGYTQYPSWYSPAKYYQVTDGKAGDTIKASNCLRYLTPDDPAHHFTFNEAYDNRKIFYVTDGSDDESIVGQRYTRAPREQVSVNDAAPKIVGSVDAGGDKASGDRGDYALLRGFFRHEKTDSGTVDRDAIFYYSDGMFYGNPYEYNDHLATASWVLAFAGSYLREGGGHADSYKYKHACGRQFLSDIGCPDENIYVNDSMTQKPGLDTIGVTIGSKNLQAYEVGTNKLKDNGDVLIPVSVRGGGYEAEWASNTTLGTGDARKGEAQGFSEAADQVMSEIDYYIAKHGLEEKLANGQVKFWVTGFSRAGATANLVSKRLVEKYAAGTQDKPNQVFGYPCEPPKGGTDKAEQLDPEKYYCIHNLINDGDMVPLVAPGEMGFKRYGVDHYIPGTEAGSLGDVDEYGVKTIPGKSNSNNGSIDVTTYVDNAPLKTKTEEYNAKKTEMMANLKSIDSEIIFDDYFHPMAMDFFPGTSTYEAGAYDNTHVEDFLKDFFAILQDAPGDDDSQKEARTAVRSRQQYAGDPVEINGVTYSTIQQAGRDTMSLLFSLSEEDSASFAERAGSIMNSISTISLNPFSSDITMVTIWKKVIGNWTDRTDAEKMTYINFLWDALAQTKALETLPPDDLARLEKNWPTLADMIFRFVEADYRFYPGSNGKAWAGGSSNSMMYTPTFMTFASYILKNHAPEVGIAWARIEDNYYGGEDDLKEYVIEPGTYKPDAPSAKAGETELSAGDKIVLVGDQKIVLDAEKIKGEAVYYTLKAGDEEIASDQVYRGAIDIAAEDGKTTNYTLTTYARSYKKDSDPVTYEFSVASDRHEVTILYGNGTQQELIYDEGDQVVVAAEDSETAYFTGWDIEDGEGKSVTEFLLTDEESKAAKAQFTMPEMGTTSETPDKSKTYEWKAGYKLTVKAIYELKIDRVSVDLPAPDAGVELASEATVSWGSKPEQQVTVPVAWTYEEVDGKTYAYSGIASNATVYKARLQIDQDRELGRIFTDKATAAIAGKTVETKKSAVDGSIEIEAAFDQTAEEGDYPRPTGPHTLTVVTKDLNNETADYMPTEEYQVFANTTESPMPPTVITAPEVADMAFTEWEISADGIEVDESQLKKKTISLNITEAAASELTIEAKYEAVLKKVEVTLDEPQVGEALPTENSEHFGLVVKISEQYEIDPENLSVEWTPASKDGKAAYLTAYTATVQVVPGDEGKIGIRPAGSDASVPYIQRGAQFTAADAPDVTVNGEKAFYDAAQKTVTYSFNPIKYTLKAVKQPDTISDVARGTDLSKVLPKTTTAVLADPEKEITVPINWGEPKQQETTDPLGETTWTVSGTADMKDFEDTVTVPDGVSLEVATTITVRAAETVAAPRASLDSGTYLANQAATLSSRTAGAHIYYTTDGTKATTSSKEYKGETIEINRADMIDGAVIIRAIATKEDMRPSVEAVYQYEFTNKITIPKGKSLVYNYEAQTGVNDSDFYTLTPADGSKVIIDDNGAATAVNAGEYSVTAKIKDGYEWSLVSYTKTEDGVVKEGKEYYAKEDDNYVIVYPDGSENPAEKGWFEKSESTTEPQTITFTIKKANLKQDAQIRSKASYNTVAELKRDVKVTIYGQELSPADYTLTISPVVNGQVTVTVKAKGNNCQGTLTKVIKVAAIDQMGKDGTAFSKGASAGAANNALIKMKSNKDPKGTKFSPLKLKSTKQGKTSVKLTWKKAKGAIRYVVYGAQSGQKYKRLTAVSGKSYNVKKISKKLKKKTYHKFIIVALDKNGNVVTTSKVVHVATKGNLKKAANPKKVVVKAKVNKKGKKLKKYKKTSSIGLKKGKKTRLKASFTKAKKAKVKKKVGMRYESSNTKIATVTAKGVVKGKKKGKCRIYVYAQNGICKTIKVTVR